MSRLKADDITGAVTDGLKCVALDPQYAKGVQLIYYFSSRGFVALLSPRALPPVSLLFFVCENAILHSWAPSADPGGFRLVSPRPEPRRRGVVRHRHNRLRRRAPNKYFQRNAARRRGACRRGCFAGRALLSQAISPRLACPAGGGLSTDRGQGAAGARGHFSRRGGVGNRRGQGTDPASESGCCTRGAGSESRVRAASLFGWGCRPAGPAAGDPKRKHGGRCSRRYGRSRRWRACRCCRLGGGLRCSGGAQGGRQHAVQGRVRKPLLQLTPCSRVGTHPAGCEAPPAQAVPRGAGRLRRRHRRGACRGLAVRQPCRSAADAATLPRGAPPRQPPPPRLAALQACAAGLPRPHSRPAGLP